MNVPRLLLTAPASGCGKTTMTCAILQALVERHQNPIAFKSGPDYIDPMFHRSVMGVRSRNLDLFLMGEQAVRQSLVHFSGDVAVLEGAMGYYDGIALSSEASAFDLARRTKTPVVLIVDGRGAARSLAALVKGFCALERESGIRGVLLNRVSPMLYPRLKTCIEEETGIPVYGFLPPLPDCAVESRHLGLVTAGEIDGLKKKLTLLAHQAEQTIDLDGLLALGSSAPSLAAGNRMSACISPRPRIAIARDAAFCFYYEDALHLLEAIGAELTPFSPLQDAQLPCGCSGLYLGGGYPELYGEQLAGNHSLCRAIHEAVLGGMPTVAECGGFLYLHQLLSDVVGKDHTMTGVFPLRAWNAGKLSRFGYVTLTAEQDGLLCKAGEQLPAHEFHYWESESPGTAFQAQKPKSTRGWVCGYHTPNLYAGFPHFHFCGCPSAAERFVAASAAYQKEMRQYK